MPQRARRRGLAMKALVLLTTLAAMTAGGAGAVLAYQSTGAVPPQRAVTHEAAPIPTPTVTSIAPCKAPAKLERGECITHRVQTRIVVIPAPRVAAAPVVVAGRKAEAPRVVTRVVVTRVVRRSAPTPRAAPRTEREHENENEHERESERPKASSDNDD